MLGFTLMLAATSKAKKPDEVPPAPSAKNAPAVHGSGVPADVDIVLVTSATGCDKKPAHAGCKLLKEFDGAEPYVDMPKTKVVWYGESIGLGGAGDAKVSWFAPTVGPKSELVACMGHGTPAWHQRVAGEIAAFVKPKIGW